MIQKTFGIYDEAQNAHSLFIEAGEQHFACWTKDYEKVTAFEFFAADEPGELKPDLIDLRPMSQLLNRNYFETFVTVDDNNCLITDANLGSTSKKLVLSFNPQQLLDDTEISNVGNKNFHYAISATLKTAAEQFRGRCAYAHKYEKLAKAATSTNVMYVVVYPSKLTLMLKLDSIRFFINSYPYKNAEDVLYRILHIMDTFSTSASEVSLQVMGLINTDSNIYKELYSYFPKIATVNTNKSLLLSDAFSSYPSHYFSPFLNFME